MLGTVKISNLSKVYTILHILSKLIAYFSFRIITIQYNYIVCSSETVMSKEFGFIKNGVLIVDDDKYALEEISEALSDNELDVYKATNSDSAVLLAKEYKPKFILMDYNLPDANGIKTIEEIRTFLPKVEVIMMSGHDDFIDKATLSNTGSIAVLKKPLSVETISRYIHNMLDI